MDIITILIYLVRVMQLLIVIRAIFSWLPIGQNPVGTIIVQLTDPIIAPIRKLMPRTGMFDLSPMIVIFLLVIIEKVLQEAF